MLSSERKPHIEELIIYSTPICLTKKDKIHILSDQKLMMNPTLPIDDYCTVASPARSSKLVEVAPSWNSAFLNL
jgi:hypothetical protein